MYFYKPLLTFQKKVAFILSMWFEFIKIGATG